MELLHQADWLDRLGAIGSESAVPCGLKNVANTCYLNSTLQCFLCLPEILAFYAVDSDSGGNKSDPITQAEDETEPQTQPIIGSDTGEKSTFTADFRLFVVRFS